jgi:rubrerythrin
MSHRDNEDRLGVKELQSDPPFSSNMVNSDPVQKPLSFAVPTEFVSLPSQGKYPVGHPLHDKKTIEIRFMTAKEEDILASQTLIKNGLAIDRMLQSLIVDKNIDVDDLLVGDKNALTIAARVSGYGKDYSVKITCPSCGSSEKFSFDLNEQKTNSLHENLKEDDQVKETDNGTFLVTLPTSKYEVEVKLLTGKDEKELAKIYEQRRKSKKQEATTTEQLKLIIVSVMNNTNKNEMANFIENMPAKDSRYLREVYTRLVPNVDLTQEYTCDSCGYTGDMEVPITVGFFWPGR